MGAGTGSTCPGLGLDSSEGSRFGLRSDGAGYVPNAAGRPSRADVRVYETQQQAVAARAEFGAMPLAKDGW